MVGNFVIQPQTAQVSAKILKVDTIGIEGINFLQDNGEKGCTSYNEISPIQLDEYWLSGFGFERVQDDLYRDGFYMLYNLDGGDNILKAIVSGANVMAVMPLCHGYYSADNVNDVHHLQNLHYAFSKKELTWRDGFPKFIF